MIIYKKGGRLDGRSKIPDFIEPRLTSSSTFKNGRWFGLSKPEHLRDCHCSLGADKEGFFLYTHRASSKRRMDLNFTKEEIKLIESTG
jgi:hypothetical protein